MQSQSVSYFSMSILSAALLFGCASPDLDQDLAKMKSAQEWNTEQTFTDHTSIEWPTDTWWERYQDTQLNQLIREAFEYSPTLQMAKARLDNARGIAEQAGAARSLDVGLAASASESKVSYQYQSYSPPHGWNDYGSLTLNFQYDFDFWGKNRASIAAATSDLAAAEVESVSAHLMLATSIANAYAELARLYANQTTVVAALGVREKTVELLQKRYDNGLETLGAVSQAKSIAASVDAELLALNESIELQKNALAALVGQGPDRARAIYAPTITLNARFGLPADASIGLLGHRTDVVAARWRAEAAAERVGIAQAMFYPDVSFSAFIGYQAFGLDNVFNSGNDAGGIGPAIYLPLFTGGRLEGQLTSAQARYQESVSLYNATLNQALHDVADVLTSTQALDERIAKTQQAVIQAERAHYIANNRYQGGLATYLDVLVAEETLLNNQRALVNLQSRAFSLDLALIHALGGGFSHSHS
ncbi:efflux transporter outer membrane subunit [Vibrio sp. V27_P1S3P104]|uniref:efflux transporter outer membrane subunit n=1 Tax=unclassified Vibrio TaxID=2614977 RepID=UPI001372BC50|nr:MULTISPECIES: efflux transporter outer membrane subunit [unclassified Vibrio]NAW70484.1 efflux transporter outer membrane subunit [Vibrio sp. V28_P6S34P95]NAX04116.1 efflux transporter outer membrane subunit [Vibrio sp. V30_P3S12P165]NAX34299.1 efflux transporter outer membrane subunit [Vibrio sp. V29_P1S30P107]NAX37556.1 efflux transporter outer membrane subunit [Vibrio sp. V27_P1S3P104]NAX40710.1 efflux transporter outer membrane subunit [Vibrio sp. V26_P1S5P106]